MVCGMRRAAFLGFILATGFLGVARASGVPLTPELAVRERNVASLSLLAKRPGCAGRGHGTERWCIGLASLDFAPGGAQVAAVDGDESFGRRHTFGGCQLSEGQ